MTRVLIATNEPILARGMEAVLTADGLEIAAICHDVSELFECLPGSHADVAVIDMPLLPAPGVIHDLERLAPQCQLVLWPRLRSADSLARLTEAIHMMVAFSGPGRASSAQVSRDCSESERRLLALMGHGLNDEEIADALGSDQSTVQKLVKSLSVRLGSEDRYELALYGLSFLSEPIDTKGGSNHG